MVRGGFTMKKIVIMITFLLLMLTGCGTDLGEELFSCNSDNMLGVKAVYAKDNKITLCFDTSKIKEKNTPNGLYNWMRDKGFDSTYDYIYIRFKDDQSLKASWVSITVDDTTGEMQISFKIDNYSASDITAFHLNDGSASYDLDISAGNIHGVIWGGDCANKYDQNYNSSSDSWGEITDELEVYPETNFDE